MGQETMNAIVVNNVIKRFRMYKEKNSTLKERLLYVGRTKYIEFLALENVNLTIPKGKTVGLIGKNGSGKSTLLKILTRILYPDKGDIQVYGRVSSLLELGAGFHPDFSGRENIYMNASIMGLSKKEIDSKLEDIIRFSELEDFIDHPVRSYSSGMYMRLAFSVAINVEPDILLIDEVLAVGDASFQRKCINRIKELKRKGITIVFVSHDQGVMEKLCDEVYWLNEGKIIDYGDPKRVIDAYLSYTDKRDENRLVVEAAKLENTDSSEVESDSEERWGSREIEILNVRILDEERNERYMLQTEENINVEIDYVIYNRPETIAFGVGFWTIEGLRCYGTNTYIDKTDLSELPNQGRLVYKVKSLSLLPGLYRLDVAVHSEDGVPYDFRRGYCRFEVRSLINDSGIARINHTWEVSKIDAQGVEFNE